MVLITGATGLVGSYLAIHLLENNENVRAIYRTKSSINKTKNIFEINKKLDLFTKINWIRADINDISELESAFQNIECVYHCAALISFDPRDEDQLRKVNIEGTANIVNFCLKYKVKKLCYVSSIAALGDLQEHQLIINEETEWNPEKSHSDYAISKYGAEIETFRGQQEGLNVVIVNPGVILGAGFLDSGSGEIFSKVKSGLNFYTNGTTAFVSVLDLVKIMYLLMKSNISGEKFVIISENWTYKKLLDTISNTMNIKKPKHKVPEYVIEIMWRLDWILANVFMQKRKLSKDLAQSLFAKDIYSSDKIKNTFNFEFEDLEFSIKNVVKTAAL
ncbi:MAG: NAD-dependent epimerase/dehydratase family protein [Flavobacterium sp.]|nr:NAD-dependent epimerase/dehydratase family protein [Flavobacterium sp.]